MSSDPEIRSRRWALEAQFFDSCAEDRRIEPVHADVVARFTNPVRPWSLDFCFRAAGDLTGKRVLDVGSGTGENALVLAALGAQVTALDISPASLEVVQKRAELSGLADRISTICAPVEAYSGEERYDVIWCNAFLHHVTSELPAVIAGLQARLEPGGRIVIAEPFSPRWLRRLRMMLPISTNGTPDERPLWPSEIRLIRNAFPGMKVRYFLAASRLERFVPAPVAEALARIDTVLLRMPVVRRLGGAVVLWT